MPTEQSISWRSDVLRSLVRHHGVTVLLVELLALVYVLEWYVADAFGVGTYVYVFVATARPSPGWVLAPLAHTLENPVHLLSSVVVILLYGSLVERTLPRWRYVAFCAGAAYVSIGAQVATYLTGEMRGTLGASGVAMAMVAFVTVDATRRRLRSSDRVDGTEAGFALLGSVLLVRRLERDVGLLAPAVAESALAGHLAGAGFGLAVALWAARR